LSGWQQRRRILPLPHHSSGAANKSDAFNFRRSSLSVQQTDWLTEPLRLVTGSRPVEASRWASSTLVATVASHGQQTTTNWTQSTLLARWPFGAPRLNASLPARRPAGHGRRHPRPLIATSHARQLALCSKLRWSNFCQKIGELTISTRTVSEQTLGRVGV